MKGAPSIELQQNEAPFSACEVNKNRFASLR